MNTFITWFKAARPHTMGLSFAVILAGSCQVGWAAIRLDILCLSLLSAAGFQLISNFANDYGDFKKGTDSSRPESYRALSAGHFSPKQIKKAIVVLSCFSLVCVVALVTNAPVSRTGKWTMLALGFASVLAAIGYTMGKRPYGYFALGDAMVFLFFGGVGVIGSYYLQADSLTNGSVWLLALAYGTLSTTVLNINNIRDLDKDLDSNKRTVANLLGHRHALYYQRGLFAITLLSLTGYTFLTTKLGFIAIVIPAIAMIWRIAHKLSEAKSHQDYNRCLAATVKYTFWLSLPTALLGTLYNLS